MADPNPRASKKANVVDQIEPSGGLFYAYVHEVNGSFHVLYLTEKAKRIKEKYIH